MDINMDAGDIGLNYKFDKINRIYHGTVRWKDQGFEENATEHCGKTICDSYSSGTNLSCLNKNPILVLIDPTDPSVSHLVVVIVQPTDLDHEDQVFEYFSQCFPQLQFEKFFREGINSKSSRAKTAIGGPLRILFPTKEAYTNYKGAFFCAFFEMAVLHSLTKVIAANKSYAEFCEINPIFFQHPAGQADISVLSIEKKFDILLNSFVAQFPHLKESLFKKLELPYHAESEPMGPGIEWAHPTETRTISPEPKKPTTGEIPQSMPKGKGISKGATVADDKYQYVIMPPPMVNIMLERLRSKVKWEAIVSELNSKTWVFLNGKESTLSSIRQLRRKPDYDNIRAIVNAER